MPPPSVPSETSMAAGDARSTPIAEPAAPPPPAPSTASPASAGPPSPLHQQLDALAAGLDDGKLDASKRQLASLLPALDRDGPLDEQLAAHALMGRIHVKSRADQRAAAEFDRVRGLWSDPSAAVQSIGVAGEPETARYARLGRALGAVGEALFFAADQYRKKNVDPLRYPAYRGAASRPPAKRMEDMTQPEREREMKRRKDESEALQRHINGPVKTWVEAKRRAIEEAEKEYSKVLDLQPVPPPRWVVASAARVGQMWDGFVSDFRQTPMPSWMLADPQLSQTYQSSIESASEPMLQRARAAFQTCQGLAARAHVANEFSAACSQWLDAHPN